MSALCEQRLAICRICPLARKQFDGSIRCDSHKYLSPDGSQTSFLPKKDWIKGCGCLVNIKCNNPSAICVAGKW